MTRANENTRLEQGANTHSQSSALADPATYGEHRGVGVLTHHAELAQQGCQPHLAEIMARRRDVQPARMAELAHLIRVELRAGIEHAVRAGSLLIDAKRVVDHGHWLPWLSENFGLSERSAQNYMKLSRDMAAMPAANAKRVALLPLREALESIAKSRRTEPRTDLHPATGKQIQTAAPKPPAKITPKAPAAAVHTANHDVVQQPVHGEHVVDGAAHGGDDGAQVLVLAVLLDTWDAAKPDTRKKFLTTAHVHDEIMRIVTGRKSA